jgi:hypothetical protein
MWIGIFLLSILIYTNYSIATTHIEGDISEMTFKKSDNPYIVDDEIFVPANKILNIDKGCIFLFKMYTGLNIFGQLYVFGTSDEPVVFTSIYDKQYTLKAERGPDSFDWNGIFFSKESKVNYMNEFMVSYSVYGIKSENPVFIIKSGVFKQNGQYNLTINDRFILIEDGIPFYFYPGDKIYSKPIPYENKVIKKIKSFAKRTAYNPGTLPVVFGVSSLAFLKLWNDGRKKFEKTPDIKTQNKLIKKGRLYSGGFVILGSVSITLSIYHINKKFFSKEKSLLNREK